jgi:hypothetical protein
MTSQMLAALEGFVAALNSKFNTTDSLTSYVRSTLATVDITKVDPYGSWLYMR